MGGMGVQTPFGGFSGHWNQQQLQNLGWGFSGSVPGLGGLGFGSNGAGVQTPFGGFNAHWQNQLQNLGWGFSGSIPGLGGIGFGHNGAGVQTPFGGFNAHWNQLHNLGMGAVNGLSGLFGQQQLLI